LPRLSETTAALTIEAVKAAKKHGVIVSYDLNYRPSLWKSIGGLKKAQEVNREIAKYVDVMIGNEEDFTASLGFEVKGADHSLSHIETDAFKAMIETAVKAYPNFKVAATTLRRVITATKNDWSAILWHDGKFHESRKYPELEILDRVGGGDSFASGLQFGFLEFNDAQKAVEYGAAHGALASTTPGDTSMATRKEVEKTFGGGSARVNAKQNHENPGRTFFTQRQGAWWSSAVQACCAARWRKVWRSPARRWRWSVATPPSAQIRLDKIAGWRHGGIFLRATPHRRRLAATCLLRMLKKLGRVDILVNGAGINSPTPFFDIPEDEIDRIITVNLKGVVLACQIFGKHMVEQKSGSIINLGSASGLTPLSRVFTYSASKAAVHNLSKNLAREWATSGVRVNILVPGFFPAEQNRKVLNPERVAQIMGKTPMKRFGESHELVGATLLLASDAGASLPARKSSWTADSMQCPFKP
jgi:2-dehydro-3-deoxygluconokinase